MKKGFTLVEILVAMATGILLLIALYSVYVVNSKSYRKSVNQQELAQNGRIALERMTRDIRQTYEITTILPPTETDFLNPPKSYIQFQDGHETAKIQYIKYSLDDTNLVRQIIHYSFHSDSNTWVEWDTPVSNINNPLIETSDPAKEAIKADKISSLKFYGEKIVNIELQVSNPEDTFSFRTEVWGRNI